MHLLLIILQPVLALSAFGFATKIYKKALKNGTHLELKSITVSITSIQVINQQSYLIKYNTP